MIKYDVESIKEIPIQDVLKNFYGIECHAKGKYLWCAIRNEHTPSCRIYPQTNTWCDFGDGSRGGNVINLVQHLERCEWKEAIKKLGENYNIQHEFYENQNRFPSAWEFKKIGIAFDKATLNFDFHIDKYGLEHTQKFSQKYNMNIAELNSKYPKVYHNMLRSRAMPFLNNLRNDYYSELYFEHQIRTELGDKISLEYRDYERLIKMAKGLSKIENILSRAITEPNLLKFSVRHYEPISDLKGILAGKIQIEVGNTPYPVIKQAAKSRKQNLVYQKMGYLAFVEKSSQLPFKYAAFLDAKTNEVNICCFSERIPILHRIYNQKSSQESEQDKSHSVSLAKYNTTVYQSSKKNGTEIHSPPSSIYNYCKKIDMTSTSILNTEMDR